jgi:hypothetical protein
MRFTRTDLLIALAGVVSLTTIIMWDGPTDAEFAEPIEVVSVEDGYARSTTTTTTTTEPRPVTTTAEVVWVDTTTTTLPYDLAEFACPEWIPMAVEAGWPLDRLAVLDDIMWEESRCLPGEVSGTSDWGLLQVNRKVWRQYVESFGLTMDDLLVPQINLWVGLQIAAMSEDNGWRWCSPWDMSGVRSC